MLIVPKPGGTRPQARAMLMPTTPFDLAWTVEVTPPGELLAARRTGHLSVRASGRLAAKRSA